MKKLEVENIQWLVENYDFTDNNMNKLVVGIDSSDELNGADIVVYDVTDLNHEGHGIQSIEDLSRYCDENGADEESWEINRATLIRADDF